jgi:hypothetical protein
METNMDKIERAKGDGNDIEEIAINTPAATPPGKDSQKMELCEFCLNIHIPDRCLPGDV